MCEELGFGAVRTYIASGNVILDSRANEREVKAALEDRLAVYAGKPMVVQVRTAEEMRDVELANPFPRALPQSTVAVFLDTAPPPTALADVSGRVDEEIRLGRREIYIAYGAAGIGRSKLKIPAARLGTARNMNTVATLARMALERR